MHVDLSIFGPGAIALAVLFYAIWGMSFYVFEDSVRRPSLDYTGVWEGRWFYAAFQGVFFAVFLLAQFPFALSAVPWLGTLQVALIPFALAQQIAYLLRVVFPTRKRLEARAQAREAELAREYGVESATEGLDGEPFAEPTHEREDGSSS